MAATLAELEARLALVEARLEEADAVHEIARMKARYGELVDARTAPGTDDARRRELAREISLLFSEDGVWDGGPGNGRCEGRAAIEGRLARQTLAFSWHFFVKPRIRVAGARAWGTWDLFAPFTTADGRAMWMTGVEDDEYTLEDGLWLHRSMQLRVIFSCPYEEGWARPSAPRSEPQASEAQARGGQGPAPRSEPQASEAQEPPR